MKLQLRTVAVPLLSIAMLVVGLYAVLNRTVIQNFQSLEQSNLETQIQRVRNTFDTALDELSGSIVDWAQWDQTVAFLASLDETYIDQNLNPATLESLGFTDVYYFRTDGTLRYGVARREDTVRTVADKDAAPIARLIAEGKRGGMIERDGALLIFSSAPILPNDGSGQSRGTLVATTMVDDRFLSLIPRLTNLTVDFMRTDRGALSPAASAALKRLEAGEAAVLVRDDAERAEAYGLIVTVAGKPALITHVTTARQIMKTGVRVRNTISLTLAAGGFAAMFLLAWIINAYGVRRIQELTRQVGEIAARRNASMRLDDARKGAWSIVIRTAAAVFGVFALFASVIAIGFHVLFMGGFSEVETSTIVGHLVRAERALEYRIEKGSSKVRDWGQWDDTYRFIDDLNADYATANLGIETLAPMGMKHFFLFALDGALRVGKEVDAHTGTVADVPQGAEIAAHFAKLAVRPAERNGFGGLLRTGASVEMVSGSPVLDTERVRPSKGTLLFGYPIDAALTAKLAKQTELELALEPMSGASGSTDRFEASENTITGTHVLDDLFGSPALRMKVTVPRIVHGQGVLASRIVPWYFAVGGLLATIVTILSVYFSVFSRFRGMARELSLIATAGDAGLRVSKRGSDEIGSLADHINSMLQALEEAQQEAVRARDEAERAKWASTIIGKVSHELRTPLNGILGMLRIALREELPPSLSDHLSKVGEAADGLLAVINDILDFSKFSSGKVPLDDAEFEPASLLREVINTVGARVYERERLDLFASVSVSATGTFRSDPLRLKQVLMNLTGNAVKFTRSGFVSIRLDADESRGMLRFAVADSGTGIQPDRLEAIFEPFAQADDSPTRRYSGTGLGLTIVKQIVDAMDGSVSVESLVGRGSTFFVEIPLRRSSDAMTRSAMTVPPPVRIAAEEGPLFEFLERTFDEHGIAWSRCSLPQLDSLSADSGSPVLVDGAILDRRDGLELFERFVRLNPAALVSVLLAPQQLGLKSRLAAAGGRVTIVSKPTLSLDLVRAVAGESSDAQGGEPSIEQESILSGIPLRVIVAEDAPLNQFVLKNMLESKGFTVVCVDDGDALVRAVDTTLRSRAGGDGEQQPFDLIITDIQMPKMDGLEATGLIRARESDYGIGVRGSIPIIALTANAFEEEHRQIRDAGTDAVVIKPIEPGRLWKAIAEAVRSGRMTLEGGRGNPPGRSEPATAPAGLLASARRRRGAVIDDTKLGTELREIHDAFCASQGARLDPDAPLEAFLLDLDDLEKRGNGDSSYPLEMLRLIESTAAPMARDLRDTSAESAECLRILHRLKGTLSEAASEAGGFSAFQAQVELRAGRTEEASIWIRRTLLVIDGILSIAGYDDSDRELRTDPVIAPRTSDRE